jgi:hypothetical protein
MRDAKRIHERLNVLVQQQAQLVGFFVTPTALAAVETLPESDATLCDARACNVEGCGY